MMEWTWGSMGVKTPLDLFLAAILHLYVAWNSQFDKFLSRSSGQVADRILKGNPNPRLSDEESDSTQVTKSQTCKATTVIEDCARSSGQVASRILKGSCEVEWRKVRLNTGDEESDLHGY